MAKTSWSGIVLFFLVFIHHMACGASRLHLGKTGHAMTMTTLAFKKASKRYALRHAIPLNQAQEELAHILGFKNLHQAQKRFAKLDPKAPLVVVPKVAPLAIERDGEILWKNLRGRLVALEKQIGRTEGGAEAAVDRFLDAAAVRYPSGAFEPTVLPKTPLEVQRMIEEVLEKLPKVVW